MGRQGGRSATGSRVRIWVGGGLALLAVVMLGVLALARSNGGLGSGGSAADAPSAAARQPAGRPPGSQQQSGQQPRDSDQPQNAQLAHLARRQPGDPLARGRIDAPVVLVEWEEFQCPFCGRYTRNTEPELIEKYVQTGKVRIEWHDYPYLGKQSTTAAHAGRAAAAQGKFWAYHDYLFQHQKPVNSGTLTTDYLVRVAGTLGMDTTKFRTDMASKKVAKAVEKDKQQALNLGITGTPAFLIGAKPTIGAQPTEDFERIIDKQLAKVK